MQKDTFGYALYSYWKGDHKTPHVIRRDDGFSEKTDTSHYFSKQLTREEKRMEKYVAGKILDVGCGAGRAYDYFQKRKFITTGIDASKWAVKTCKQQGLKNVILGDIFVEKLPKEHFDTILLFGNNIGIAGNFKRLKPFLKKLLNLTRAGGHLLLTSINVNKTKNKKHLDYHSKNRSKGIHPGEVKIRVEYKGEIGSYFKWIHVESETLAQIAKETGWSVKKTFNYANGSYGMVLEKISRSN